MTAPEHRVGQVIGAVFGAALHLIVGVFYLTSGLVAPPWAAVLLIVAWAAFTVLLWRWRRSPVRALLLPFGEAALWYAVISAGETWLGWTA
jgi:hypothetical protein